MPFLYKGKSFVHIKNTEGVDIQKFSSYPDEQEILLNPSVNLEVMQVETDGTLIDEEISKIIKHPVTLRGIIDKFVVLDGSKIADYGPVSTCDCGDPKTF